jgi:hypothetical protein
MKIRQSAAIVILCLNSITAHAAGTDIYAWWSSLWSPDPNAGTTIFPSLEVPLGGRLEGMGTASTALARDAGFLEANPAATAVLDSSELTFSHHGWIADTSLEGIIYAVRFGDLGLGFAGRFLYVPFTSYDEWGERPNRGTISETVATANVSYNFFSSYSFPGLAAGANLRLAYRHVPTDIAAGQSIFGVMGDVGLQTSFSFAKLQHWSQPNFSLGVAVRNLGITTMSDESLPLTASAGIAYAPLRPWTIAGDFNLPFSIDANPARDWDLALGTSVAVVDFLSLQGGVHLKPGNPRMSVGADVNLGKWSIGTLSLNANYNLDLSAIATNPADKLSVQARLDLGDGGRAARRQQADELYRAGLQAFSVGDLERAKALWEQALKIDPKHTLAKRWIPIVERTLKTRQEAIEAGSGQ